MSMLTALRRAYRAELRDGHRQAPRPGQRPPAALASGIIGKCRRSRRASDATAQRRGDKGNADKAKMVAAIRARGFAPADDNEADAIALLL
ncbi:hypothetical protein HEQ75_27595, partial [Roseomonas sp. BU-1]|nr:hypothetical protein [Falsiroseomonas selenitidurans]